MVQILVATPAYAGLLSTDYFSSALNLSALCREKGIGLAFYTSDRESLISRARNVAAAEFMGNPDFTHLMFIDADIGFQPQQVLRMLEFDKPVVGGAYPMKEVDWAQVLEGSKGATDPNYLRERSAKFALNLFDEDLKPTDGGVPIYNGFVRVSKIGTGFLLIKREVFNQLVMRFPELKYENDIAGYENDRTRGNFWAFFDTIIHPTSRRYLSEDYGFCHLWTQGCGGEVWADIQSQLIHHGSYHYSGSCLQSLQYLGRVANPEPAAPAAPVQA